MSVQLRPILDAFLLLFEEKSRRALAHLAAFNLDYAQIKYILSMDEDQENVPLFVLTMS